MIRLTNTNIVLLAAIAVLIGVIVYMYTSKTKENMTADGAPRPPMPPATSGGTAAKGDGEGPETPCLTLFHADWCPHCKHVLPEWEKIKQALQGKHAVADFESKHPMMTNFQIKGFPTIRYFPKGMSNPSVHVDYSGERTADAILKFLEAQK